MNTRHIAKRKLVLGLLLFVTATTACSADSNAPSDAASPLYESIVPKACRVGTLLGAYLVNEHSIVVLCVSGTTEKPVRRLYSINEDSHEATMLLDGSSAGFNPIKVVGNVMYMTISDADGTPQLSALRLDAGVVAPSTVLEMADAMTSFGVSGTHAYWTWSSNSSPPTYALSRVLLAGGPKEDILFSPFAEANDIAIVGDDVYVLGHLFVNDYSVTVERISLPSHQPQLIFGEPKGDESNKPWFGVYRDHVLWTDTSAVPAKVYEIHGSTVQRNTVIKCAPHSDAVLSGDVMAFEDRSECVALTSQHRLGLEVAVDLSTEQANYYTNREQSGVVFGARDGWIYMRDDKSVFRVRPDQSL